MIRKQTGYFLLFLWVATILPNFVVAEEVELFAKEKNDISSFLGPQFGLVSYPTAFKLRVDYSRLYQDRFRFVLGVGLAFSGEVIFEEETRNTVVPSTVGFNLWAGTRYAFDRLGGFLDPYLTVGIDISILTGNGFRGFALSPHGGIGGSVSLSDHLALTAELDVSVGVGTYQPSGTKMALGLEFLVGVSYRF